MDIGDPAKRCCLPSTHGCNLVRSSVSKGQRERERGKCQFRNAVSGGKWSSNQDLGRETFASEQSPDVSLSYVLFCAGPCCVISSGRSNGSCAFQHMTTRQPHSTTRPTTNLTKRHMTKDHATCNVCETLRHKSNAFCPDVHALT